MRRPKKLYSFSYPHGKELSVHVVQKNCKLSGGGRDQNIICMHGRKDSFWGHPTYQGALRSVIAQARRVRARLLKDLKVLEKKLK